MLRAVAEHNACRAVVFDRDAADRAFEPYLAAALLDGFDQHVGEPAGAAGRIITAVKVVAEQRHHLAAGQHLGPVADIVGEHGQCAARLRILNMLRHQIVERLVEPAKGKRVLARKIQHGVDRGRQPGDAAIVAAGRIHAVIDGADIGKQRREARRVGGKQVAEFADIVAPVARHVEGEARQAVGVIETPPFDPFGDAEPLQHRRDRAAGPYAGKIVRAGIEAVETRFAEVARLAYEGVAESTRHDMVLGNDHLETGIGQERRRRQSADAGADNRHVDSGAAASAAEFGRRPAIGFRRSELPLDRRRARAASARKSR